jgi:hypothetical protein
VQHAREVHLADAAVGTSAVRLALCVGRPAGRAPSLLLLLLLRLAIDRLLTLVLLKLVRCGRVARTVQGLLWRRGTHHREGVVGGLCGQNDGRRVRARKKRKGPC